jgi:hypothetical protein
MAGPIVAKRGATAGSSLRVPAAGSVMARVVEIVALGLLGLATAAPTDI